MTTTFHDPDAVRRVTHRLRRARGQMDALITAVEGGADCRAVVTQLAAVSSALDRAGFTIVSTAMRECLSDDTGDADGPGATRDGGARGDDGSRPRLRLDELEKLFLALA